jgi:hypothetical protein
MTKDEALKLALEALKQIDEAMPFPVAKLAQKVIKEALAQPEQEPVAWNVIDPTGKIVATEMNSVRGWARIEGYKPTVEGLLGFHEQGWRVVPTTPPQRTWVGLTDGEVDKMILLMGFPPDWTTENAIVKNIVRNLESKLKEKNT